MNRFIVILTAVLLSFTAAFAQKEPGTIRGVIKDKESGEALIGVNILVKSTYYGATTDVDGFYVIADIEPGDYTLEVSYIGYKIIQRTDVKVAPGGTSDVNFSMESTPLALGQEVEVIGEKPLVDLEETSTIRGLTEEEISNSIADEAMELISQQVGVVAQDKELHIRGGRAYEAQYLLDGVSVQDPLSGTGFGLNVSASALEAVEVITGGFQAEYGQATSGVVNVRTKSGGDRYQAFLSYLTDHAGLFPDAATSFNTDIVEFNLGGPEPITNSLLPWINVKIPGKMYFFLNFYSFLSDDYTRATSSQLFSSIGPRINLFGNELIDETTLAPRQNNNWSGILKLTWKISPRYSLTFAYNRSVAINQNTQSLQTNLEFVEASPGFPYTFQQNLDNFNTFTHDNEQVGFTWQHTLSKTTFYELRISNFFSQLRADWQGRHWSEYIEPVDIARLPVQYFNPGDDPDKVRVIPGDGFFDYGNDRTWHDHFVDDFTLKGDLTSIFNNIHTFKVGFESSFKELQLIDIADPAVEGGFGSSQDIYSVKPADGAFYVQDDIKFNGFFLNAGLRLDYWMPGSYVDDNVFGENSTFSEELQQQYEDETINVFGNRVKLRLMPRLGVSHPVSNNMMLYFNYGHFSKRPKPQFVYAKLGAGRFQSAFQTFGNPTLDPETSVKYEMGVRYRITNNSAISINAYYTDIFDYVQTVTVPQVRRGIDGITYVNLDYARGRGMEMEYKVRFAKYFSSIINGSYSIITSKSSSSDAGLLFEQEILQEQPIREVPARWDRPWTISLNLAMNVGKGEHPSLFGLKLFDDWDMSLRYFAQAGRRYTPAEFSQVRGNDGRPLYETVTDQSLQFSEIGKPWKWLDFEFSKYFVLANMQVGLRLVIKNVFDDRNPNIINPVTGDAYVDGDDVPSSWNDPRFPDVFFPISSPFPNNPARYRTPRNIRFGFVFNFN